MTDKTLTAGQINEWLNTPSYRAMLSCSPYQFHQLCSMALRSLDAEGVRVPREPIPEMIQAWHDRMIEGATYIDRRSIEYALYVECYKAMLAAAPEGKEEGWPTKR